MARGQALVAVARQQRVDGRAGRLSPARRHGRFCPDTGPHGTPARGLGPRVGLALGGHAALPADAARHHDAGSRERPAGEGQRRLPPPAHRGHCTGGRMAPGVGDGLAPQGGSTIEVLPGGHVAPGAKPLAPRAEHPRDLPLGAGPSGPAQPWGEARVPGKVEHLRVPVWSLARRLCPPVGAGQHDGLGVVVAPRTGRAAAGLDRPQVAAQGGRQTLRGGDVDARHPRVAQHHDPALEGGPPALMRNPPTVPPSHLPLPAGGRLKPDRPLAQAPVLLAQRAHQRARDRAASGRALGLTAIFNWMQHNSRHGQTTREHPGS
jgi:hypothetical protein